MYRPNLIKALATYPSKDPGLPTTLLLTKEVGVPMGDEAYQNIGGELMPTGAVEFDKKQIFSGSNSAQKQGACTDVLMEAH